MAGPQGEGVGVSSDGEWGVVVYNVVNAPVIEDTMASARDERGDDLVWKMQMRGISQNPCSCKIFLSISRIQVSAAVRVLPSPLRPAGRASRKTAFASRATTKTKRLGSSNRRQLYGAVRP
jgi:hypothetical protein